jgi:putative sugar O-methyltransferase
MKSFTATFDNFKSCLSLSQEEIESDESLLSEKYIQISKAAQELFAQDKFRVRHIRTWSMQDDMGVPVQFRRLLDVDAFFFENLVRFLRSLNPLLLPIFYFQKVALLDDLRIIQESGAIDILLANPVDETPHVRDVYRRGLYKFNSRYLRYIYLANQIRKNDLLSQERYQIHLDIGNFYGGLQALLKTYYPKTTFISIELPHQLFRSYLFHSELYPDTEKIVGLEQFVSYMSNPVRKPAFVYLLPRDFDQLGDLCEINLLSNYLSFGEMSEENFKRYLESKTIKRVKKFHFVNRFVSNPRFDPTFNANIKLPDYFIAGTRVKLLDIFPIHHYSITRRKLLGRKGYRNASSPQFELIQERMSED